MYPVPLVKSEIAPLVTTASVTTYPTTLLLNSLAPSIVYERHIGAPVFPNFVPLVGIDCKENTKNKEYIDEKEIDHFITKRVQQQINEYQKQEKKQKLKNVFIYSDCHCQCNKSREAKELTLDEKIERIRDELNLTKEKDEDKLIRKLHKYQKRYEEATNTQKTENNCSFNFNDYKINYLESTSKNDAKIKRTKSKSPSRSRSHWVPTGSNDYSSTNSKREELANKQRNYIPFDSEQSTSLVFFDNEKPKIDRSSILTIESYKPSQTIFETTVDSKTTVIDRPNPPREFYCTTNYVTDHSINSKSNYVTNASQKPMYYEKTAYPLAKEYYYHPINRNDTFYL
ncbi:hypothetical protein BpHYR1_014004 [Brachionus plicatilis]|uniref:Uncharacterized protein n=1 Tax=Brachionus plicatilis TaxID=10195 RepID=A0A3M7QUC8_BRAPC|nr:hypothetical protein BpHYR1_014004 [Brachionus plicatilis]